jgi:hypothetical protein
VDSPAALPVVIIEPAALPAVTTPPPALPVVIPESTALPAASTPPAVLSVPYEVPVSYAGYVEPPKMQPFFPPCWDMSYEYVWWHPAKWRKATQLSNPDVTMEVVVNPLQQEVPASLPKNLTGESSIIEVENELDYLYLGDSEMILETIPCANNFFQLFGYIFL